MSATDPRAWLWNEALAMIERAEHLHRRFFEPSLSSLEVRCWEPPVDVFETDRELWIAAALPGVEPKDLQLSIEGDALRICGQRRLPLAARAAAIRRMEIPNGRFERSIRLPARRLMLERSELVNGCLIVSLTKQD